MNATLNLTGSVAELAAAFNGFAFGDPTVDGADRNNGTLTVYDFAPNMVKETFDDLTANMKTILGNSAGTGEVR